MLNAVDLIRRSKTKGEKIRSRKRPRRNSAKKAISKSPRRAKRRAKRYKTGIHKSAKCGSLEYRSSYERDYAVLLDNNPEVASYSFESLAIPYEFGKRHRKYIPDFVVTFVSGLVEVHEVKPQAKVGTLRNKAKFKSAHAFCASRSMTFHVITEKIIYRTGR
jgi:hypothetical protein